MALRLSGSPFGLEKWLTALVRPCNRDPLSGMNRSLKGHSYKLFSD